MDVAAPSPKSKGNAIIFAKFKSRPKKVKNDIIEAGIIRVQEKEDWDQTTEKIKAIKNEIIIWLILNFCLNKDKINNEARLPYVMEATFNPTIMRVLSTTL